MRGRSLTSERRIEGLVRGETEEHACDTHAREGSTENEIWWVASRLSLHRSVSSAVKALDSARPMNSASLLIRG